MKEALASPKDVALKLALEALQWSKPHKDAVITHGEAITTIEAALAQQNDHSEQHLDMVKAQQAQEPAAWHLIEASYPKGEQLDIRMGDGSILCDVLPQADGDLW